MEDRTRNFLQSNFRRYYSDLREDEDSVTDPEFAGAGLPEVPELQGREFGFIDLRDPFPDDVVMRRHASHKDRESLYDRLIDTPPAHVYYSAAVYEEPRNRRMNDKGWKGADLIFDLDMDHLRDMPDSFPAMLEAVREETVVLVEEFLLGDLGVPDSAMQIAFSGGRGYHVHVRSDEFFELQGRERREIVDYVKGRLSPDVYLGRGKMGGVKIPSSGETGWRGRLNLSVVKLLEELRESDDPLSDLEEVAEWHDEELSIGETGMENLLSLDPSNVEKGFLDPPKVQNKKEVLSLIVREAALRAGADIDEPVTSDTHRLIRLPGSLHGGSGLRVTPLTLEELREFSPLEDAVAFNDDPVLVEGKKDFAAFLRGEKAAVERDEETEVPRYAAVFMALRGGVEVK